MKILIASKIHRLFVDELQKAGHECMTTILKNSGGLEPLIGEYHGIVVNSRFMIGKDLIDKARKLQFVARIGSGMESIDTTYLEQQGIRWFNSPEGNRQAVGEHTLALLLNLLNKINIADRQVRHGQWIREANRGLEVEGKTIGIIGYGNMGSSFARCLHGFDSNVIAYDKYKSNYSDDYVCEKSLEELFEQSDIVSMHVPLTEETKFMVNDVFIRSFKKNIYLLNTSRGKVLKTADLVENLKSGKVLGAALDVLEYESASFEQIGFDNFPEPMQYLATADNVILTPHIAGWSVESNVKHAQVLARKIVEAFNED
ncbi:MAG TPA: NAD(P)-dependent oxidoreductase [Bacteroidales bacterium]|nr:NAD(P)-dependent oxidoreductase [Bacteroidales bacterium]